MKLLYVSVRETAGTDIVQNIRTEKQVPFLNLLYAVATQRSFYKMFDFNPGMDQSSNANA